MTFAAGGSAAFTNLSLERNAHIRGAQLTLRGDPVLVPTLHHLNASTVSAGSANAWTGNLSYDAPDLAPEAYIGTPFNSTQLANASLPDGDLAKAPVAPNFTYQLLLQQVPILPTIELRVLWSGYSLPPSMPIFTNGRLFAFNFTSLAWDLGAAYPYPLTGVQEVNFNTTHPANYIKPGTGSVAIMIVSESTQTEVFTDFFEITVVSAVWPRPAVDVGNDGSIDWRFDAPGYGSMGRQWTFDDGFPNRYLAFPDGGGELSARFLVPEGIDPEQASVIVRGVPDPRSAARTGGPVVAGASAGLDVTGLPGNSIGDTSAVRLIGLTTLNKSTDTNLVARTGSLLVGSDPSGYRAAAQTFNVSANGPLATVSVFVYQVQGNPGPLVITIEALNGTGIPAGSPIAQAQVPQALLANDTWVSFVFSGVPLTSGTQLSIVARAPMAPPDTTSNYLTLGAAVNNSFLDGEALSYVNVTGLGETWGRPSATDLLFDLRQDLPTSSGEAALINLDSVSGTFSQSGSSSNLSFSVPSTPLANGSHTFSVLNSNPNPIRFNWTASVNYALLAEQLSISVENSTLASWNFTNLTAGAELDLTAAVSDSNFTAPPGSPTQLRTVTLLVNSSSSGAVDFSALDIRYSLNITTPSLAAAFDTALWATPFGFGRADVPIWVYSAGASQLEILEAAITYDRPPIYSGFPSVISDEDVPIVADLYSVFQDDYDLGNLEFHFDVISGSSLAFVALRGYNLTITPTANLSGDVVVHVTAIDSGGLVNASREVTFTFAPVNDAPRLTTNAINVTWGGVQTVDLSPFMIDAESTISSLSIADATGAPVTVIGRGLVFNFTAGAPDVDLLVTLTDGSASAAWPLHVHPRISNSVPILRPIATLEIPADGAYRLDLGPYASDVEDPFSALTFSLLPANDPASPLLWVIEVDGGVTYLKLIPHAPAGTDVSTTLTVRDTDGNTNTTTLGVRIVGPPNVPPTIVGLNPSITLGPDPVQLFLVIKATDPEDGQGVPLNWTLENHDPQLFSATIDPLTLALTIEPVPGAKGTGTLVLHARDSGGAADSFTISVQVDNPSSGSAVSFLALGGFAALVILGTAIAVRKDRKSGPKVPKHSLPSIEAAAMPSADELELVATGGVELPDPEAEDVGAFMRGETQSPSDTPPTDDERVQTLGLKSDLDGLSAGLAVSTPTVPTLGAARMAELYLFSLKDGGLLYQAPPVGVPVLPQMDENEFLQWSYDTVRRTEKHADTARVLEWREWKVVVARGQTFFVAGRATGEDFDRLRREVKTLVEEVDHNFPGTALDWQRTEMLESVTDVLKRLVRGA